MDYNNKIIKKNNMYSILHCYKYMIKFYKKNNWSISQNKKFECKKNKRLNIMHFNFARFINNKILFEKDI